MDWLSKLLNTVKNSIIGGSSAHVQTKTSLAKKPVFNGSGRT